MGIFPSDERDDPFAGLRVAITGGTSGLGLALVRELHDRGARVAFVARTRDRVERVARGLAGVHGVVGDVSRSPSRSSAHSAASTCW
jgi:NAD(P)-dependent dehydrogenase (short-subunit alcohol dehydrogenase family)